MSIIYFYSPVFRTFSEFKAFVILKGNFVRIKAHVDRKTQPHLCKIGLVSKMFVDEYGKYWDYLILGMRKF